MATIVLNNAIIENIDLVVFDKDGTLFDLYTYCSNMIKLRAELLQKKLDLTYEQTNQLIFEMGIDEKNLCLRPEGPVGLKKREIIIKAASDYLTSLSFNNTWELCRGVFKTVDKTSQNNFHKIIKPIDGLYDLINDLLEKNCKIAIATNDRADRVALAMKYLNMDHAIDMIVGADGVINGKPNPEMINKICSELNIFQSKTVMVGDTVTDIKMGINAKVKTTIGVCTGITPKHKLLKITNNVVDSIADIIIS